MSAPPSKQCEAEVWIEGHQCQCPRLAFLTRPDGAGNERKVCGVHKRAKLVLFHRSYVPPPPAVLWIEGDRLKMREEK